MGDGAAPQTSVRDPVRDPTNGLMVVAAAAVGVMVMLVARGLGGAIVLPAAVFATLAIVSSIAVNQPDWASPQASLDEAQAKALEVAVLVRNSRILGAAYAFAALAMQLLYVTPLTGLKWQHGWQYASAFALLAVIAFEFARLLATGGEATRRRLAGLAMPLNIGQSVFAAGGLAFLTLSGKIFTRRPDWAANIVFLFAAFLVMVLGAIALRTQARLPGR